MQHVLRIPMLLLLLLLSSKIDFKLLGFMQINETRRKQKNAERHSLNPKQKTLVFLKKTTLKTIRFLFSTHRCDIITMWDISAKDLCNGKSGAMSATHKNGYGSQTATASIQCIVRYNQKTNTRCLTKKPRSNGGKLVPSVVPFWI